jgi:hypothetical protein
VAYSEPQPQPVIDSDSTKVGRWLRARRLRLAIWVAVIEGIIVAVENDISKWTVMILAIAVLTLYFVWGRGMQWDVGRQLAWISAASQVLALLVALFAFILWGIALGAVAILAILALVYLYSDLRQT